MRDLHPRARALIDAAKRGEGSLSPDIRARVRRSVLRRSVALGAAVATASTTSAVSKAAALLAALPASLAVPAMVAAVAGAALVVFEARSTPRARPPSPSAPMLAVAPAASPQPHAMVRAPNEAPVIVPRAAPPTREPSGTEEPIASQLRLAPGAAPSTQVSSTTTPAQPPQPRTRAKAAPVTVPEPAARSIAPPSAESLQAPSPALAEREVPDARTLAPSRLADDLALLRLAHQALRVRDPATALSLLDRPDSRLDAGPLGEEAQLARISALCQLGRTTEAHAATARLLAAWPGSPAGKRLRDGCAVLVAPHKGNED